MPDFFVIGAQKAGTTTLHDWLSTQPNICLPAIKETHFFSRNDRFEQGYEWYVKQFMANADSKIMGEVDPDYLFMPGVIEKMVQSVTCPKFIVILREPLKRAYSHYMMSCYRGYEKLSFIEALETEEIRLNSGDYHSVAHFSYLSRSLYSSQIIKFKKSFPSSKFYFARFDDLFSKDTRENEFAAICKFIDFTPEISKIDFDLAANVASSPRAKFFRDMVYNDKSLVRKITRPFARMIMSREKRLLCAQNVEKLNRKKIVNEGGRSLDFVVPQWVRDRVGTDLNELQSITGLDVTSWHDAISLQ